ncbi:hypothetical protein C9I56_34985 [Paraburkholderia caribensis]|nr:hypothetical protein C9I56_34985 [Paraburkholderia caribensis]
MAGKAAHKAKPPGPLGALNPRTLRPFGHQVIADVLYLPCFHEVDELEQQPAGLTHLEAQTVAQVKVLPESLVKRVHSTPPGQAITNVRKFVDLHLRVNAG